MESYYRKVVPFQSVERNGRAGLKGTGYYKLERRHERYKITLNLNEVLRETSEDYLFCIVSRENALEYAVHKVQQVQCINRKIEDSFIVDERKMKGMICGIIYLLENGKSIDLTLDARFVGFIGEPFKLDLIQLQWAIENDPKSIEERNFSVKSEIEVQSNEEKSSLEIEIQNDEKRSSSEIDIQYNEKGNASKTEIHSEKNNFLENETEIAKETPKISSLEAGAVFKDKQDCKELEEKPVETGTQEIEKESPTEPQGKARKVLEKEPLDNETKHKKESEPLKSKNLFESLDEVKKHMEKDEIEEYLEELFGSNKKMNPFEHDEESMEWIKIEITDLVFLPIESWIYINNAFLMSCYRKYKHLILGRRKGEGNIYLGVPDIYFFKESIIANLCGFFEFNCTKNCSPKPGEYGYWLIKTTL